MNAKPQKYEEKHSRPARTVSGAKLYELVTTLRRKGYTASFGADKDPKLVQK